MRFRKIYKLVLLALLVSTPSPFVCGITWKTYLKKRKDLKGSPRNKYKALIEKQSQRIKEHCNDAKTSFSTSTDIASDIDSFVAKSQTKFKKDDKGNEIPKTVAGDVFNIFMPDWKDEKNKLETTIKNGFTEVLTEALKKGATDAPNKMAEAIGKILAPISSKEQATKMATDSMVEIKSTAETTAKPAGLNFTIPANWLGIDMAEKKTDGSFTDDMETYIKDLSIGDIVDNTDGTFDFFKTEATGTYEIVTDPGENVCHYIVRTDAGVERKEAHRGKMIGGTWVAWNNQIHKAPTAFDPFRGKEGWEFEDTFRAGDKGEKNKSEVASFRPASDLEPAVTTEAKRLWSAKDSGYEETDYNFYVDGETIHYYKVNIPTKYADDTGTNIILVFNPDKSQVYPTDKVYQKTPDNEITTLGKTHPAAERKELWHSTETKDDEIVHTIVTALLLKSGAADAVDPWDPKVDVTKVNIVKLEDSLKVDAVDYNGAKAAIQNVPDDKFQIGTGTIEDFYIINTGNNTFYRVKKSAKWEKATGDDFDKHIAVFTDPSNPSDIKAHSKLEDIILFKKTAFDSHLRTFWRFSLWKPTWIDPKTGKQAYYYKKTSDGPPEEYTYYKVNIVKYGGIEADVPAGTTKVESGNNAAIAGKITHKNLYTTVVKYGEQKTLVYVDAGSLKPDHTIYFNPDTYTFYVVKPKPEEKVELPDELTAQAGINKKAGATDADIKAFDNLLEKNADVTDKEISLKVAKKVIDVPNDVEKILYSFDNTTKEMSFKFKKAAADPGPVVEVEAAVEVEAVVEPEEEAVVSLPEQTKTEFISLINEMADFDVGGMSYMMNISRLMNIIKNSKGIPNYRNLLKSLIPDNKKNHGNVKAIIKEIEK